jgi:UDP-N-acetylglucosamine:LPS N-acetylglucosamine transferase
MIAISSQFERSRTSKRVLAVSSGGGHWVELLRLMPAFEGADVAFVTVNDQYRTDVQGHRFYVVNDATRWNKAAIALMAARLAAIVVRERPDVVITTGAAPGYFAMRFAKMLGAKTVWLDSIANVDELSMSGQMAGNYADLWLTQWPHLATRRAQPDAVREALRSPSFAGAVL